MPTIADAADRIRTLLPTQSRRCTSQVAIALSSAVFLALTGCSSTNDSSSGGDSGTSATTVRINGAQGRIFGWVQYVAVEKGFLSKYNIEGKIIPISSGPADVTGLVGGSLELTLNGVGLLAPYIEKGVGVTAIGGVQNAGYDLVLPADSTVADSNAAISSLKGESVAIPSLGSAEQQQLDLMLQSQGLSPSDVTYLAAGTLTSVAAALKAGRVPAAMVDPATAYTMVQQGYGRVGFDYFKDGANIPQMAAAVKSTSIWLWTTSKWAKTHPEAVAGVQKGFTDTVNWMVDPANSAELIAVLQKGGFMADVSAGQEQAFLQQMMPQMTTVFDTQAVQDQLDYAKAIGSYKGTITPDQVVYKPAS